MAGSEIQPAWHAHNRHDSEESPAQLIARLKRIAGKINAEHDVAGLCRELPTRVEELARRGGGKLAK